MMNRCSSSYCNQVGPCSCGSFHTSSSSSNNSSFSMFFSNNHKPYDYDQVDHHDPYSITTSSSSVVDCTLSLGTPSTRQSNVINSTTTTTSTTQHKRSSTSRSCIWDIFQTKQPPPSPTPSSTHHSKSTRGGGGGGNSSSANLINNLNGDPLLSRRCANCDTTSTPLWRNGPRGPKSLCNACGIRYKKEERRATSTTTTGGATATAASNVVDHQQYLMGHHHQYSWAHHQQQTTNQKVMSNSMTPAAHHHHLGNEFMFVQSGDVDHHRESDTGIPFLSWRLNVPERSGLVHDYTC